MRLSFPPVFSTTIAPAPSATPAAQARLRLSWNTSAPSSVATTGSTEAMTEAISRIGGFLKGQIDPSTGGYGV